MSQIEIPNTVSIVVSKCHTHTGLKLSPTTHGAAGSDAVFLKMTGPIVQEQVVVCGIVGDKDIGRKILIEVGDDYAERFTVISVHATGLQALFKGAIPFTDEKSIGNWTHVVRMTDSGDSIIVVAGDGICGIVVQIIANVEIQQAIGIQIRPGRA